MRRPYRAITMACRLTGGPTAPIALGEAPPRRPPSSLPAKRYCAGVPERMRMAAMSWSVDKVGLALLISIAPPMLGEWESLLDEIDAKLDPRPAAIHLPSRFVNE